MWPSSAQVGEGGPAVRWRLGDMEWQGQWVFFFIVVASQAISTLTAVSGSEISIGQELDQGSTWEIPLQFSSCDPSFNLGCAEENKGSKSNNQGADLKILPKGAGDESTKIKEPLCTVNCFRADPVCGSDGVTYWCGAAEAKCAEVEVAHEGYCDIWNGGVGANLGLHAAQSLQLVHMVWLVLAGLLIVIGLP